METTTVNSPQHKTRGKRNRKIKGLYNWHSIIGLITILPVISWTLSGLMHPFMAHFFNPEIANTFLIPNPIEPESLMVQPKEALESIGASEFKSIRAVNWEDQTFYQIKMRDDNWVYVNTETGEALPDADRQYSEYLARKFIDDHESPMLSAVVQEEFDNAYKYVNRLLPVWRLDVERSDRMTIYVDTASDRLGTFNTSSRKAFLWFFSTFHNWSWLEGISNLWCRTTVMILLLGIIAASSISGLVIYGFMWNRFKKPSSGNKKGLLRKYHRQIGLATALVTLTFAFSGAYQATSKYTPNVLPSMAYEPLLQTSAINTSLEELLFPSSSILNFGIVKMEGQHYYQLRISKGKGQPPTWEYVNATDGSQLKNGDEQYAIYLSGIFAEKMGQKIGEPSLNSVEEQREFNHEYGFIFKRLPVQKIEFGDSDQHAHYIETGTSRLAASIANPDRARGVTFAVLHKFFFMDWAGKTIRDLVMMVSALGVLVVSLFGFVLFLKK